jgi:hypothetical protein
VGAISLIKVEHLTEGELIDVSNVEILTLPGCREEKNNTVNKD